MALIGNAFYQVSSLDPGVGYPMYYWNQTDTGLIYVRAADDSGWVLVGNSIQPYLGQLSTQGGNMNGAITGAHGLSPAASNNFTTLQVGGIDVALKTYVDSQVAILNAEIGTGIVSALSSIPALNLGTRIARATGIWTSTSATPVAGFTIPLPQYSDGVSAVVSECIWGAALSNVAFGTTSGHTTQLAAVETPVGSRIYTLQGNDSGLAADTVNVLWWIIGFRSQT